MFPACVPNYILEVTPGSWTVGPAPVLVPATANVSFSRSRSPACNKELVDGR
jgi:hypothetical protein